MAEAAAGPRIAVALCTHDRYRLLGTALGALSRQSLAPDAYEILVIDNTPDRTESDRQARLYRGLGNLRWFHAPIPGLAGARNMAMWQAAAPLLAFIDDDALADPGWLAGLLAGFETLGPAVHLLGGPVHPLWEAPRPDWLADGMLGYLSLLDRGGDLRVLAAGEWLVGTNVAYRVAALRAAGGFSPALGRSGAGAVLLSNEETELADRLHAAGGLAGWAPAAVVQHRITAERLDQRWFRRRAAWQAVSDFIRNPAYFSTHFATHWGEAARYVDFHAEANALAALAAAQRDAGMSHWEVSAIYHLTLCLLGGLAAPESGEGLP